MCQFRLDIFEIPSLIKCKTCLYEYLFWCLRIKLKVPYLIFFMLYRKHYWYILSYHIFQPRSCCLPSVVIGPFFPPNNNLKKAEQISMKFSINFMLFEASLYSYFLVSYNLWSYHDMLKFLRMWWCHYQWSSAVMSSPWCNSACT